MNIQDATREYETWLAQQTRVERTDLESKHKDMSESTFTFLRATYYRWAQLWTKHCKDLARATPVLAVGDLHVENFGTWRDSQGRLIWGINDFDEACPMSFANDLVRLAVSVKLAIKESHLLLSINDACVSILKGYTDALKSNGKPFILEEEHTWLRKAAEGSLRDPEKFWKKLDELEVIKINVPDSASEALRYMLPDRDLEYRLVRRTAGEGSLGRQRFVALADWKGGRIAREAKAIIPSSYLWANKMDSPYEIFYTVILSRSVRCPDPCLDTRGQWVVRRLAPDCCKVEIAQLEPLKDELRLMNAMGWETANIHLGTPGAAKNIRASLSKLKENWLIEAAGTMERATIRDWKTWRQSQKY